MDSCIDPEGWGIAGGPDPPPLKIHKNIDFSYLENHKAHKLASNVGPASTHQQNAIL